MIIISTPLTVSEIKEKHANFFAAMVKIVVDVEKEILALDAEMHADLEQNLLEYGSEQKDLWGANIYFDKAGFIEFNSLINIRPAMGNMSMDLKNAVIQEKIRKIVDKLIIF